MQEYLDEIQRLCVLGDDVKVAKWAADAIHVAVKPFSDMDEWFCPDDKGWGQGQYIAKVSFMGSWLVVARWELWQMKNCCAIMVSTKAEVASMFRGRGIGRLCNMIRIESAKRNGYKRLLCTAVLNGTQGVYQRSILEGNGWEMVDMFINPRTDNAVGTFIYKL